MTNKDFYLKKNIIVEQNYEKKDVSSKAEEHCHT